MRKILDNIMEAVFMILALVSIVAVVFVSFFLFSKGIPAMNEIGLKEFLTGQIWRPGNDLYGILPMIIGSLYVTAGALVIGVPVGIFMAVFISKFCPERIYKIINPIVNLLAGIPSVIYGFFGLAVIVPFIREHFGGMGTSIAAASVILGVMILPTIISVSESALRAVPEGYYEGALALGATKEKAVFKTVLPAARSGVMAATTLGIGRAIGETMAVAMVVGNQPRIPNSIFEGVRTLTTNIVLEMGYSTDLHREALIATGVVLFVFILIINLILAAVQRKAKKAQG